MAPTLALRFLSLFLFLFMNGHGISARDLKVELQDKKQVDSSGAVPGSKDQPYIAGYRTTPEFTQPNYLAGYKTTPESTQPNYLAGYITTPESTQPNYMASYGLKHNHPSHHGKLNRPYITGYTSSNQEVNKQYLTGYIATGAHDANQPNYITAYGTKIDPKESAQDNDKPYITQYGDHDSKQNPKEATHDATQPNYLAGYITTPESTQPNYMASYGLKHNHPSHHGKLNRPYITAYTSSNQEVNKQYLTGYIATGAHDANQPNYITAYGTKIDPKESAHDNDKPYITQYGDHDSKQNPKEATQDYAATYKKNSEESKGPTSSVDHTEAFKAGFFTLDDLHVGNVMTLQFPVQDFSHFRPRKEADSIPFSTPQLPSVLQLLSISEDSTEAQSMRDTLNQCEAETITGETKICANSLESMLEFVDTIIGSETKYNILTTSQPTTSGSSMQKHTILEVSQDIYAPKWVACHPLPYPYAIYYCHHIATGSKIFKVSLGGENGDKIEALGICHLDTSDWSPNHILFKQLGIKPGEAPVCHFFPVKHLMWVPQPSKASM